MPVRIDEIESDIELEGDAAQHAPPAAQPAISPEHVAHAIERRASDDERTRAWDFDD